jgi:hypothetical protein
MQLAAGGFEKRLDGYVVRDVVCAREAWSEEQGGGDSGDRMA